ncbi:MAG TPA: phosphatase PAP2 family protein [Candidatus Acidoferrum sp.]
MFWPWRLSRFAICVASLIAGTYFALPVSAQKYPLALSAKPNLHLLTVDSADACPLLTADVCHGLPQDPQAGSPNAPAPDHSSNSWTVGRIVTRLAHDQASIYIAPFQKANLKWDFAFVASTGLLIATDRHTIGIVSRDNENISRDISNVGLYGTEAAAGAIFITGLVTDDAHAKETGFLTGEALLNALPVYGGLQLIAGRERPDQGSGHGRFFQDHAFGTSFPSGHAMFTWTMAAVIAHEYPRTWVKVLAYSTAAAVSVTRYTGREHFVADVAVGSFLGYFIGRHIFNLHCEPGFHNSCHK